MTPELDLNTLLWVLKKDTELQHKVYELRQSIHNECDRIIERHNEKPERRSESSSRVRYETTARLDRINQLIKESHV